MLGNRTRFEGVAARAGGCGPHARCTCTTVYTSSNNFGSLSTSSAIYRIYKDKLILVYITPLLCVFYLLLVRAVSRFNRYYFRSITFSFHLVIVSANFSRFISVIVNESFDLIHQFVVSGDVALIYHQTPQSHDICSLQSFKQP